MTKPGHVFAIILAFGAVGLWAATQTPSRENSTTIAAFGGAAPGRPPDASSLSADVLISPEDLAKVLQSTRGEKPLTIFVGFPVLYPQAHVPGSEFIGPASREEFLEKLRKRMAPLARKKFVVIYCGCCPWNHCPNVKPAYEALCHMGFTNLRVLYIRSDFGQDWVNKGFPVEKGQR